MDESNGKPPPVDFSKLTARDIAGARMHRPPVPPLTERMAKRVTSTLNSKLFWAALVLLLGAGWYGVTTYRLAVWLHSPQARYRGPHEHVPHMLTSPSFTYDFSRVKPIRDQIWW